MSKIPEIETEVIADHGTHFTCSRGGKTFKVAKSGLSATTQMGLRKKMSSGGLISAEDQMPGMDPDDLSKLGPWRDLISQVSKQTGADPYLLGATMLRESGGDPRAEGDGGHSKGLFQIHDQYHPGISDDPVDQTKAAADIYRDYAQQLGPAAADPRALPAAYNAGPTRVRQAVEAGSSPDTVTTDGYGKWVAQKAEQLRRAKVFDAPEMTQAQAAIAQNDRSLANATGRPVPAGPAQAIGPVPPEQTADAARMDRPAANAASAAEAQKFTGVQGGESPPLYENPMFQLAENVWKSPAGAAQAQQERVAAAGQPQQTAMGQAMAEPQGQPQSATAMGTGSFQGQPQPQLAAPGQAQMAEQQAMADQQEQGDLFGAGARNEVRGAAEQMYGAAQGAALAQQHLAESNLAVNNWLTQESEKLKNQRVAQFQQWQQRGDEQFKELLSSKVDPDRWFASRSTGQKIAGVIAMALGGMLQGRTGGRNPAMDMINAAIERDVDAQKANIDQKNTAFRFHLAQGADQREAYALAKADITDRAAGLLRMNLDKYQGAMADPTLQNTLGQLRMQALQQRQQLAMGGLDMDYKKLQIGATQMRTALQTMMMQQAAGLTQQQAAGRGLNDQQVAMMPEKERGGFVQLGGAWYQAVSPEEAGKVREAQDSYKETTGLIGDMRKQRQENGRGWLPRWIGKDQSRALALRDQMYGGLRKMLGLGVLNKSDYDLLEQMVPDVGAIMQGDDTIYVKLDTIQSTAQRKWNQFLSSRVIGFSDAGKTVNATPVGQ